MAKKIPLGRGRFAIVDDQDFDLVSKHSWHLHGASKYSDGYAVSTMRMHRLIIDAPLDMFVDHINGDSLDNRRCNLRLCTNAQNQQNTMSRKGTSIYKGVSYNKKRNKWIAQFISNGTYYYCGSWSSEKEAAMAVDKKRQEVCGEFATINLLDEY